MMIDAGNTTKITNDAAQRIAEQQGDVRRARTTDRTLRTPETSVSEKVNLSARTENLLSSESRIQDGNQAKDLLNSLKQLIPQKADDAFAAQANLKTEDVLSLF